jgi:hypothetical protein
VIREDKRARKMAIVADYLVNPGAAFYSGIAGSVASVMDVLVEDGWGLMKGPPHVLPDSAGRPAAATIAGDACDYLKNGYTVVVLAAEGLPRGGVWLDLLEEAFSQLDTAMPNVARVRLDGAGAAQVRSALAAAASPSNAAAGA